MGAINLSSPEKLLSLHIIYHMPTKSKRNYSRRRRRRPYKRYKRPYTVSQNNNGIARRQIVRMTYVQQVLMDPAIGTVGTNVFRANGCFDPDLTGSGTQPYGFDQWMPFYNHYVVLGSKCSATFTPIASDGVSGNFIASIALKASTTTQPTDVTRNLEYPHTVYRQCGNAQANNGVTLTKNCSVKKFLGRASVLSDPALKGTSATDPSEQAYFHVSVSPTNQGYNIGAVTALVRINYLVALIEPKILPKS